MAEILKVNNPEDAKKAAQKIKQEALDQAKEKKGFFEELLNDLSQASPESGGFDEVAVLLSLPDEKFNILGPIFLAELEKNYNDVNTQFNMAQLMNAGGIKAEDIRKAQEDICKTIDEQLSEYFSRNKRDFLKQLVGLTYNAVAETDGIAKRYITIPLEYCREGAKMPAYAHNTDAGLDIYALEDITIAPGETKLIPTGIKVAIPLGYELQVRPKSGRCLKTKLRIANTPGTIDSGYRDEIGVIIDNIEPFIKKAKVDIEGRLAEIEYGQSYTIGAGEKFVQLVLSEVPKAVFYEVESVKGLGEDRKGGFGSTGLK